MSYLLCDINLLLCDVICCSYQHCELIAQNSFSDIFIPFLDVHKFMAATAGAVRIFKPKCCMVGEGLIRQTLLQVLKWTQEADFLVDCTTKEVMFIHASYGRSIKDK